MDCISLIREMKNLTLPVGIFFEADNPYTLSENRELMLPFPANFAREESVKKSEAMTCYVHERINAHAGFETALIQESNWLLSTWILPK